MPIYGYRCSQCGHELEVFQSMSAEPLRECQECGGGLRKLLYPVGVVFKGSGFYSTDYKNGGSKAKAEQTDKAEKSEKSDKSDGDSSAKSDSSSTKSGESSSTSSSPEKKAESTGAAAAK